MIERGTKGKGLPDADGDNIPIIGEDVLKTSSNLDGLCFTSFLYHSSLT